LRASLFVLGLLALSLCGAPSATAQNDAPSPPDSTESYWGPIPDNASSRAAFHRSNHPVEHAVLAPFTAVTYPVYLLTRGLKTGLIFADEHGVLPRVGAGLPIRIGHVHAGPGFTYGGRTGFGGGGTILVARDQPGSDWIRLRYLTTTKGMHQGGAGVRAPWGARGEIEAGGGYRLERNARFFGLGPTSRKADLSYFTLEQSWAGLSYRRALGGPLGSEWRIVYSSIGTRAPRPKDGPALAQQFAPAIPEGYNQRSDGVLSSLLLRYDTTQGTGRPEPGVITQGQADHFSPTGTYGDAFWRYTGEAGAFVPLWFTDRTLAVRGAVSWVDEVGSGVVPFTRLSTNHSGEDLRGFQNDRWRDRGLLDLSAEYRWPVWAHEHVHGVGVDAYGFINSGQVFREWNQIASHLWQTSWGGGFRAILSDGFGGRIEIARSRESTQIRLRADQMFDFKGGLYAGNAHIAVPN
jgi:hypothetical protein